MQILESSLLCVVKKLEKSVRAKWSVVPSFHADYLQLNIFQPFIAHVARLFTELEINKLKICEWEGTALCGKHSFQEYTFQKLVFGNQQSEQIRAPFDRLVLGFSLSGMVECSRSFFHLWLFNGCPSTPETLHTYTCKPRRLFEGEYF